jgi:subtilisin family serine protease
MRRAVVLVIALALGLTAAAGAERFVLETGKWKSRHTARVKAAGGEIVWAHGPTGMAVVRSDRPRFLKAIRRTGAFRFAKGDRVVDWGMPPVSQQMVSPNDDTHYQKQWNLDAIDAPEAWAAGCTGAGARVAVIDGGINETHMDLAGQVDVTCSASFVPDEPFNSDLGTFWHGSHVAGIVAAADNSFGVVGVAPDATLMAIKALHGGSGSFGAVIGGILFASDPAAFGTGCTDRADIINMSLAAIFFKSEFPGFHSLVTKAVNFAASKGVLVISAAANNGLDLGQLMDVIVIPAQSGSGLAISATGPIGWQAVGNTDFRRLASYSNWGEDLVDLAGPGGDFVYPGNEDCTFDGTTFPCWVFDMVPAPCGGLDGTFTCWAAGTSMASPAAAGVAALIKGRYPSLSLGALKARLKKTADNEGKVGKDELFGHGFVNAHRACAD